MELQKGTILKRGQRISLGTGLDLQETADGIPEILSQAASGSVTIRENSGTDVGTRPRLNLIEGAGIVLTVADDDPENEIDITVAATGAGATVSVKSNDISVGGGSFNTLDFSSRFSITESPSQEANIELATVTVGFGGTGRTSLTSAALLVGAGTAAVNFLSPGAAGQVVRSTGTAWASAQLGFVDLGGAASKAQLPSDTVYTADTQTLTNKTLNQPILRLQDLADPASDRGRIWLADAGSEIRYWDDLATSVKRTLVTTDTIQTLTNKSISKGQITGLPWVVGEGGTGQTTLTSANILVGAGTAAVNFLAPGAAGQVVRSTGSAWASSAILAGDLPGHTHAETDITDGAILARVASAEIITGLWTFDRDPNAPFAVTLGSDVVTNLDSDLLDGEHAAAIVTRTRVNAVGTGSAVYTDETQTLISKTYSGGTNSGTFAGNHTLSGQVTFSNATAPIIVAKIGPSSTQQHILPVVASDTVVLLAATQTLTNKSIAKSQITGLPWVVSEGGTGRTTLTSANLLVGAGTAAVNFLAPGTAGQVVRSTGTAWASAQLVFSDLGGTASKAQLPTSVAYEDEANVFTGGVQRIDRSGGAANDFLHLREATDTEDLVFHYTGTRWELRSEAAGAGTLYAFLAPGAAKVGSDQFESTVVTGTAPLVVASTTLVTNLNADLLDGQHGSFYRDAANLNAGVLADARVQQSNVTQHQAALSIAETQIPDGTILARIASPETVTGLWTFDRDPSAPFAVTASSAVVTNLDADKVDGQHGPFAAQVHTHVQADITDWPLTVARGGTARTSLTSANLLVGAGTAAVNFLAPGAAGQVVRSTGTAWASSAILAGDLPATLTPTLIDFPDTTADKILLWGTTYGIGINTAEWVLWKDSGAAWRVRDLSRAGAVVLELDTNEKLKTFGDLEINSLGVFDGASVPDLDDVLRYNGTKWAPIALQFRFTDGDVAAVAFTDSTAAAFVDDGRAIDDVPAPVAPSVAPTIMAGYKSIIVDLTPLGTLPADKKWVIQWSIDAGATWSDATGNEIVTTGDKVVHSKLLIDGTTYRYRVRQRGATTSAASPSTADLAPLSIPDITPATIVLASQVIAVDLASLSANIGTITAGLLRDTASKFVMDLNNRLFSIIDEQATPVTRIEFGKIGVGVGDWGFRVRGAAGNVVADLQGSSILFQDDAATPMRALVLTGTRPATATTFLDFTTTGTEEVFNVENAVVVRADGTASFAGSVFATALTTESIVVSGTSVLTGGLKTISLRTESSEFYDDKTLPRVYIEDNALSIYRSAITGTSSGGNTSTTLNDTSKTWGPNQLRDASVEITGGTGVLGEVRTIGSNTPTVLTITLAWTTTPDATTTYRILDVPSIYEGTYTVPGTSSNHSDLNFTNNPTAITTTATGDSSGNINTIDGSPMTIALTGTLPSQDDKYTVNFNFDADSSALEVILVGGEVVVTHEVKVEYSKNGGAFATIHTESQSHNTTDPGFLPRTTRSISKIFTITGVTTSLTFRFTAKVSIAWFDMILEGSATCTGTGTSVTWTSGTGGATRRTIRTFAHDDGLLFYPNLVLEPLNAVPDATDGRSGDVIYVAGAELSPFFHDGSNWQAMKPGAPATHGREAHTVALVPNPTSDPSTPGEGDFWYNSTNKRFRYFDTATRTLVVENLAQTLTSKTISGGTFSGTIAGNPTLSGQVTFSNATAPIITAKLGPSSTQQHTLPVVASDTIVLLAATQVLTNKSIAKGQITGLPWVIGEGGTGRTTLTSANLLVGAGTAAVNFLAPGVVGQVVRSTGSAWASAQLQHSDLGGVGVDDHHARDHVLATTSGLGTTHTVSGLTAGQYLRATGATTAVFQTIPAGDLPSHSHTELDITDGAILARVASAETITGLWNFDRDPSAPFAVTAGSPTVLNLDADKLDTFDETAFGRLAVARTWSAKQTFSAGLDSGGRLTMTGNQAVAKYTDRGSQTTTTTIDWDQGNVQRVILGASITIQFSNIVQRGVYTLIVQQDATGSRLVTWSGVDWGNDGAPTLSIAANAVDVITFLANGTTELWGFLSGLGFS